VTTAEEAALLRSKLDLMVNLLRDEAMIDHSKDEILRKVETIVSILVLIDDEVLVESFNATKDHLPEELKGIFA